MQSAYYGSWGVSTPELLYLIHYTHTHTQGKIYMYVFITDNFCVFLHEVPVLKYCKSYELKLTTCLVLYLPILGCLTHFLV